jgi:DHA1 family tetracycline resistance protein-like MFS transporter
MARHTPKPGGRSPLFLIWTTVFIDLVGFGIIIPVLPLYADRHGATPAEIGLLLASYSAMQFVFAPILGSLSDRVGRKPVLAVSLYGTALASFALGAASLMPDSLWLIFVARVVDGITLPEPERHIAFAAEARSRFARLTAALRDPRTRLLLVVMLLATTAFAAMEATLALLLKDRFDLDASRTAWLFAYVGVVMAVVQGGLVGRLVERVGERPLVVLGTALLAAALALLGLPLPASPALLLGALGLLAVGSGLQTPAATSLVSRLTPASQQGSALGVAQSMSAIGRIAGPLLGGFLYAFGWGLPYFAGAAIMTAALALALYYNATVETAPAQSP